MRCCVLVTITVLIASTVHAGDVPANATVSKELSTAVLFDKAFLRNEDKVDHFLASAYLAAVVYYIAREETSLSDESALVLSAGISFTIGLGKEYYDKKSGKGNASCKDIIANVCGLAVGLLLFSQK